MKERKNKNYRGKKQSFKDKKDNQMVDSSKNDASWYTRNQALIADSGKIAFTWPTGTPVDLDIESPNGYNRTVNGHAGHTLNFPGVMALSYVPTYGVNQNGYDPLNIAAQNVYTYVRHVQSGHSNYDRTDLMLYLMAMDQIYGLYMHLVRAYGTIRLFSQKNRNFPRVIMNAMGFDYDDVSMNLANFRYFINNAATRIGAMVVPNTMPIFARHMWMPASIYTDGPGAKSQMYIFRPLAFGTYNEKSSTWGGYLSVDFMGYKHTVTEWCNLLDKMISAVRNSEDCGIMSGDILKAYGENVIKLPFIAEDYMTNVIYSPEVLGQIANCTVMPNATYGNVSQISSSPMIYQDPNDNVLKSSLYFMDDLDASTKPVDGYYIYKGKHVMMGLSEQPTPEEVMVNSRLMVFASEIATPVSNKVRIDIDSCGSEIVTEVGMYDTENLEGWHNAGSDRKMKPWRYAKYFEYDTGDRNIAMAVANYFSLHPAFTSGYFSDNTVHYYNYFDVDNYAIVDAHDVFKMHDTALLSMLDVPLLGSQK